MNGGDFAEHNGPVWKLRELERTRRQVMDCYFADMPLSKLPQHFLLFTIEHLCDFGRPPSQSEIAEMLHLSPATITAGVRLLERYGFIKRTQDSADQRVNRVVITEPGREAAQSLREGMDKLESAMFAGFSAEELATLSASFERMCSNLNSFISEANKDG